MKLAGFNRAARIHGWRVQCVDTVAERLGDVRRLVDFWHPIGIAVDCGGLDDRLRAPNFGDVPTVCISLRQPSGGHLSTVFGDTRQIVEPAARELLTLDCAHYAYVGYPLPRLWSDLRGEAFRDAVTLHGKPFSAFTEQARTFDALNRIRKLGKWLAKLPKPCGIFAANDLTANQVLNLCAAQGLAVPDDIAVVGVDDDESICLNAHPPLSSVLPDMEHIGFTAGQALAAMIRHPRQKPVVAETGGALMLVRRASSRARLAYPEGVARALALIREKACEGLRARDVVQVMRGSRRSAELRFREAIGHSILDEIQSVRLERAKELLADPNRTISAVANLCGYASEAAFRKVYRTAFGTSPRHPCR